MCRSAQFVHYPLAFGLVRLLDHGARPRGPCLETPALRLPADTPLDVAPAVRLLVDFVGQLACCHVPLKLCLLAFWHGRTIRRKRQRCSCEEPRLSSGAEIPGGGSAGNALVAISSERPKGRPTRVDTDRRCTTSGRLARETREPEECKRARDAYWDASDATRFGPLL